MASGGMNARRVAYSAPEGAPDVIVDALKDVGITEYVLRGGKKVSNPVVERYIEKVNGSPLNAMTNPWCAYWLGAKLEYGGIRSTKSGLARSYLRWGNPIELEDAKCGDVVVAWRGRHNDGVTGHVYFFLEYDAERERILSVGGNQGDAVSIEWHPVDRVLGIRRYRTWWQSRTVRAQAGSGVSGIAAKIADVTMPDAASGSSHLDKIADVAEKVQEPLKAFSYKPWVVGLLAAISIGLVIYGIYCRKDDHSTGKNT